MAMPVLCHGDCRDVLPTIPDASIDAVICDPPYAEIDRPYGRLSETEWHELMHAIVPQVRRVLKPSGSAMFVLQPNSEHVGRMRTWVWDFLVWLNREWNIIQDVYWWNYAAPPTVHCQARHGLFKPSLKYLVWAGAPDCYRCQDEILVRESDSMKAHVRALRSNPGDSALEYSPSGLSRRTSRICDAVTSREGATPYNVFTVANTNSTDSAGTHGHGAGTPLPLCDKLVRYLCPERGTCLDPFTGTATVGVACVNTDRAFIGIDRVGEYLAMADRRLAAIVRDRADRLF